MIGYSLRGCGVYQHLFITKTGLFPQQWNDLRLNDACKFSNFILVKLYCEFS